MNTFFVYYHFSAIQTIDCYYFRMLKYQFFCGRLFGDYFANQVDRMEILVAMAPKVVAARKVVGIPYLTTLEQINVSVKYSEENSVSGETSKIREYRVEIGKVRCGRGFYCYTHSLTYSG